MKKIIILGSVVLGTYAVAVLGLTFADQLIVKKYNLSSPYTLDDKVITYDSISRRVAWDLGLGLSLNNIKVSPVKSPKQETLSAKEIAVSVKLLPILWGNSSLVVSAQDLNLGGGKESSSSKMFSNEPIATKLKSLALLRHIKVSSNGGTLNGITYDNFKLQASMASSGAHATVDVDFAGGPIHMDLDYDMNATPNLSMRAQGKNLQLSKMKNTVVLKGGSTDLNWTSTHTGNTTESLAASTNGRLVVRSSTGELKNDWMNLMNLSLDNGVMGIFGTLAKVGQNAQLKCAAVTIDFKDGIGTLAQANGIATDTSTLMASGTLSLKSERLDLRLIPQSANGSPSTSLIKIEGTLSHPRLGVAPMDLGKAGAKILTGIMSGGMSLLAKDVVNQVESATESEPKTPQVNLCEIARAT